MLKVMPFRFNNNYAPKNLSQNNIHSLGYPQNFLAESHLQSFPNLAIVKFNQNQITPSWIKDAAIFNAINYLKGLEFDKNDVSFIQSQGIILPFLSGNEAVDFIDKSNTRIKFDKLSSTGIHAVYDYDNNFIKVNEIYKNTKNPAEILAISGAILHEAGHAKDKDGQSSVQEEISCLAMNALAHRAFVKKYPNIFANANADALIIKEGTSLYSDLFFDDNPSKAALINRLRDKYGFLPAGDFNHPPSDIAIAVKSI